MHIAARPSGLITTRDLALIGDDGHVWRRRVIAGTAVRVKQGAYCSRQEWDALHQSDRHLMRVYAVAESHPTAIFTGLSAAALYGLPMLGAWPAKAELVSSYVTGGRSKASASVTTRHLEPGDVIRADDLRISSPRLALADVARSVPFSFAVQVLDRALSIGLVGGPQLDVAHIRSGPGSRRVARAFEFASPLSDSPGESMSRAVIHELGFPAPQLQTVHKSREGSYFRTDFEWPEHRVIGEYDGAGKYLKAEQLSGMTTAEAVYAEKRREDELRRTSKSTVARWGTPELRNPPELRRILLAAGLPLARSSQ